jgi:hypothetical protein
MEGERHGGRNVCVTSGAIAASTPRIRLDDPVPWRGCGEVVRRGTYDDEAI